MCVESVTHSVLINEQPSSPFKATRGLRLGDTLSSYLFSLCLEHLSRCFNTLHKDKKFKFHSRCKRSMITHMAFADDLLLFFHAVIQSI